MPPRLPSLRRRAWRWLAGLALLGLLAEIGLRIVARLAHAERGVVFDPELGWRMLPFLTKVGPLWSARVPATTNSLGWRDDEFSAAKAKGTRRIVALGDSFTFGVGVDHGERFTEALERLLPGVEVLNLGVNAFGPDQELRLLETEALRYAPDIVVVTIFLGNDLEDIRHERRFSWPRPWFELRAGELVLHRPRRTWDVTARESSYLAELLLRPLDRWLGRARLAEPWVEQDAVPLLLALARRMAASAREAGARLLVVLAYPPERLPGADTTAEMGVREGLGAAGIPLLDTRALLAERAATGEAVFLQEGHWTARGHEAVALGIAAAIGH